MEQPYRKRLFLAAYQDFIKFWTPHRYWGTFASFVGPAIISVARNGMHSLWTVRNVAESALLGIALSLAGNIVIALWKGAKSLDDGLHSGIQNRDVIIKNLNDNVRVLSEKPKRGPSEQYNYDKAKAFLDRRGAKFVEALRHLQTHGDLTYSSAGSTMYTSWPSGMDRKEAISIYETCIGEGIVTMQEIPAIHSARKIFIAPGMTTVLNELLYPVTVK